MEINRKDVMKYLATMLLGVIILMQTACSSMQGGKFCIGVEGFNGADEHKSFVKDKDK